MVTSLLRSVPRGRTLPGPLWRRRHSCMLVLLWAHVPGLACFALARGAAPLHVLTELLPVLACGLVAMRYVHHRQLASGAMAFGLLTCSALLVHFWDGRIEAHFHFFVILSALALYEDWAPYGVALLYVVLHHGIVGVFDAASVFNHADAVEQPWLWAGIHAVFVGAMAILNVIGWHMTEHDRAQRKAAERRLRHEAEHDALTGLANRTQFRRRLRGRARRRRRRPPRRRGVRRPRRLQGHQRLARPRRRRPPADRRHPAAARRRCGPRTSLARFGGDEFVICLAGIGSERQAQRIADRIGLSLAAPLVLDDDQRYVSCSIGIALGEPGATDPDALLRDADLAMYRAKSQGKARAELFTDGLREDAVDRLEIETGLRAALASNELRLVYQPEVDLDSGRVVAVEALLRWEHPTRGTIPPDVFIPLAEVSGLIVPIGAWVAARGLPPGRRVERRRRRARRVGQRLAAAARRRRLRASRRRGARRAPGSPPQRLCLEITESAVIADPAGAVAKLQQLKALGVRLALDDFGVGQSSLSQLKVLVPVETLKIDKSFIDGLTRDPEDQAIVHAVLELARSLGMATVAEGIEEPEQADDPAEPELHDRPGLPLRPPAGGGRDHAARPRREARRAGGRTRRPPRVGRSPGAQAAAASGGPWAAHRSGPNTS